MNSYNYVFICTGSPQPCLWLNRLAASIFPVRVNRMCLLEEDNLLRETFDVTNKDSNTSSNYQ